MQSKMLTVRRAIEEPLRQISQNAGQEGVVVVGKVREGSDSYGFNAATEKSEDLVTAGAIETVRGTPVRQRSRPAHAASPRHSDRRPSRQPTPAMLTSEPARHRRSSTMW